MPNRVRLVVLSGLVSALGCHSSTRPITRTPETEPPAKVSPLRCEEPLRPGPVAMVASDYYGDIKVGPCGHLAYSVGRGDFVLLDPSYQNELRRVAVARSIEFSPDGATFMAITERGVTLTDLESGATSEFAGADGGFLRWDPSWTVTLGPAVPQSVPFICGDAGLGLVIGKQVQAPIATAVGCRLHDWSALGSRVLYFSDDQHLRVADFARADDRSLPIEPTQAGANRRPADGYHLSGDGRILLHLPGWDETCGDTFCRKTSGMAAIVDLASATEVQRVPANFSPGGREEIEAMEPSSLPSRVAVGGAVGGGVGGAVSMTLVHGNGGIVVSNHPRFKPLAVIASHDEVLARDDGDHSLWLLPFSGGQTINVSRTSVVDSLKPAAGFAVSSDGNVIAYQRLSNSNNVWELVVWSRAGGVQRTHYATQPFHAAWVGGDGTVLVQAELLREGLPPAGSQIRGEWALYLLAPGGNVLARWENPASVEQILELEDGILVAVRESLETVRLQRVNVATGAATTIVQTPTTPPAADSHPHYMLRFWTDARRQRLVYELSWPEGTPTTTKYRNSLHAGPLP